MRSTLQPRSAQKLYPFDRGWRILRYVIESLTTRLYSIHTWWVNKVRQLVGFASNRHWFVRYWVYVCIVGMVIFATIQYIEMLLVVICFLVLYILSLAIWAFFYLIIISFLALRTWIYTKYNAFFFCCPHCHKEMPLPGFRCPCGTEQDIPLFPNFYGIFSHQCSVCNKKLPTLDRWGRAALRRFCPHCKRPLHEGIGKGSNIHIVLVGDTSVGKTNYLVMAIDVCKRTLERKYHYSVSFPDPQHERTFESNIERLDTGRALPKTPDLVPPAYNIIIKFPPSLLPKFPKLLYVYDARGEIYNDMGELSRQEYYKYTKGIIFIIDPFAIPKYSDQHKIEIDNMRKLLRPADLDVDVIYGRLKETFENNFSSLARGHRYSQSVAIVINKTDALHLEDELGLPAARNLMRQRPSISTEEDAMHILVRDFLNLYGLGNFVRDIEAHFNVRYFSCSALGRLPEPSDTSSFRPIRVFEPLAWILKQTKAIKRI